MVTVDQRRIILEVLEYLIKQGEAAEDKLSNTIKTQLRRYKSLDLSTLKHLFTQDAGKFKDKCIVLKPPKSTPGAAHLLFCDWDFSDDRCDLHVYLIIFHDRDGEPVVYGYRFETPNSEPPHDFFHVQPTRTYGLARAEVKGAIKEISSKYPTFPLAFVHEISDLALMVPFSIYGRDELVQLQKRSLPNSILKGPVQNFLERVPSPV